MEYFLKNAVSVGDVISHDATNSLQYLNITTGVVGCPYGAELPTQTVEYIFSNSLTIQEAKEGVIPFAMNWIETNYPNI